MSTPEEITEQLQVFSEYLRNNNLRVTRQRTLVAESFLETDGHLSIEELHQLIRKRDKNLGLTTVFRTLKALTDCGLARETVLNDGRTRFEHIYKRPHHHHIVCMECDRAIEFVSPEWEQIQEDITSQYGFRPVSHSVRIFGVCRECQNQQTAAPAVFDSDLVFARDALKIAMETEKRGVSFYHTASERASSPSTKKTFLTMLEDEKRHLSELKKRWEELIGSNQDVLKAPVFLHFDYEALKRIFPSREEVKGKMKTDLSATEALRLAMNMEMEAYNFFQQYAQRFNDSKGRDIFLKFAAEEQEHYSLIKEEYDRTAAEERE